MEKNNSVVIIAITIFIVLIGYFYYSNNKNISEVLESNTATTTEKIVNLEDLSEGKINQKDIISVPSIPNNENVLPMVTQEGVYLVYYLNDGFYPSNLQVKKGVTVRFINNSEKAMRVFSDIQNNILYDELSQSKSVGKGGVYEFMFTEKGVWFYHNFDEQEHKANIVVY